MKMLSILTTLGVTIFLLGGVQSRDFNKEVDITWGDGRATILNNGTLLTLSMDHFSGSGFQSRDEYLFGRIDTKAKLVLGDSAGVVTTYYLSSQGDAHDEIDFEFLGNVSGQPYIVHTNIYIRGQGNREQQFYLWFDPTVKFHTYSILWNPLAIIFYVDNRPIRVYKNMESKGIPYPKLQPMRVYGSIWDAEEWATQGGRVKTNWTAEPFTAAFKGFRANACVWSAATQSSSCKDAPTLKRHGWLSQEMDAAAEGELREVEEKYMVYDYCKDVNRFPQGLPPECNLSNMP